MQLGSQVRSTRPLPGIRWIACAMFAAVLLVPATADAQYFGRNKVQYDSFDFQVLATEHFDIYYYEDGEEVIQDAARMAERWYARISRLLDHQMSSRQPLCGRHKSGWLAMAS